MNKEKIIRKIVVQDIGAIFADGAFDDWNEIVPFHVNGEMALVTWYRQGNREFNGKYVIEIEYKEEDVLPLVTNQ